MTRRFVPAPPSLRTCTVLAVSIVAAGYGAAGHAATAAGTQIKNLATVTYEDAAGNVFTAQSNEAIVTVAQVYSASVGTDIDVTGAPGQTVNLPYVLSNTGNGRDDFFVTAADDIASVTDTLDAAEILVYRDSNGNGQPDAGEPTVAATDAIGLGAGESAELVVSVRIPTTATDAQTLGVTFTASAANGTVTDLSTGGGRDGADGTNESLITVTGNAVLVTTKESTHDVANNRISYTVSVTNTGNTAARNVILFDGLPANTTFVSASESGILASNGDVVTGGVAVANFTESGTLDYNADGAIGGAGEPGLGLDLNTDGDTDDDPVPGVVAVDSELAPNASVSMTFTVAYDPVSFDGGSVVNNVGYVSADTDNTAGNDTLFTSNRSSEGITQTYALTFSDTGIGGAANLNDGGDDDDTVDDTQSVDSAASGSTVLFDVVVTNDGNGEDTFELTAAPGTFPTGTVFTFLDEAGTLVLGDTNGLGGVDSGPLARNETRDLTVRAKLPQGASGDNGGAGYQAVMTATSANDRQAPAAADAVTLGLGTIVAARSDIHAAGPGAPPGTLGTDESPLGAAPYTVTETRVANSGGTVTFPLAIDNEGGSSDSFQLQAGSTFDAATNAVGPLPDGWSVRFFLDDGAGNPTGPAISTTPSIPGNTTDFALVAVVSVPADATLAEADYQGSDRDADGTPDPFDANGDGDSDYPLFFQIVSASSGATDTLLDAVDVEADPRVTFSPSASNQIEPGGTVDYPLTVSNTGNSRETLELSSANSDAAFDNTVSIDTDGDGVPDTVLRNLVAGTSISVQLADGSVESIEVLDVDGDGNPELVLRPGIVVPLRATVLAPRTAAPGQVDTLTLTATNNRLGGPGSTVSYQTDVVNTQVRLTKTVAVDPECDGIVADADFSTVQATQVAPGQCVVWRLVAENQGDVDARNVTITDAVPAFTTFEAGRLAYCIDNACSPAPATDAADGDAATWNGSSIVYYVGPGADPGADQGGTLVPGQKATGQFSVKVD